MIVVAEAGEEHGQPGELLDVLAVTGEVELEHPQKFQKVGFVDAGGGGPDSPRLPEVRRRTTGGAARHEQAGAGVPLGDEVVVGVGRAVAHERELDGIAVGGQLLPRAGDPRQDARAAGLRRGGQVGRVDGRGGVHGVLDLLVAVGRAKAIHDDVVDVAGAVNLDADGHGGVRRARLLVSKEKAAVQPGEQPLVAVAGDADARRSWPRLRGGHGASMNAGVARSARAVASTTSAVSGLSGKTVRIADGMSLWVKSEYV